MKRWLHISIIRSKLAAGLKQTEKQETVAAQHQPQAKTKKEKVQHPARSALQPPRNVVVLPPKVVS